jgi:hypothetical protein
MTHLSVCLVTAQRMEVALLPNTHARSFSGSAMPQFGLRIAFSILQSQGERFDVSPNPQAFDSCSLKHLNLRNPGTGALKSILSRVHP